MEHEMTAQTTQLSISNEAGSQQQPPEQQEAYQRPDSHTDRDDETGSDKDSPFCLRWYPNPYNFKPSTKNQIHHGNHRVQLDALLTLLLERLLEAAEEGFPKEEGGSITTSSSAHNRFYRDVFDRVRAEAASRDDIPTLIVDKPVEKLKLAFCPTQLRYSRHFQRDFLYPNVHASTFQEREYDGGDEVAVVEIAASAGITKDELLAAICDFLHPETEEGTEGKRRSLLHSWNWVFGNDGVLGRTLFLYCDGWRNDTARERLALCGASFCF
ncbi:hypothetical protein F4779DRAFT_560024 [Xylariaceae sp. FL0662B]|nr:hypothetical protein F4779DRAFT_560024 [Xylariaceae sp. FL0662B]